MPFAHRVLASCIAVSACAIAIGLDARPARAQTGACSREYVYAGDRLLAVGHGTSIKEAGKDAARAALNGDLPDNTLLP